MSDNKKENQVQEASAWEELAGAFKADEGETKTETVLRWGILAGIAVSLVVGLS